MRVPPSGRPEMKIVLICGGGVLPRDVAQALLAQGSDFAVVRLAGEVDTDIALPENVSATTVGWGQIGKFLTFLQKENCTHVLAIGGVTKRPDFSALKLDVGGIKILPEAIASVIGGDDKVLANVAGMFEKRGYSVIGALDAVPEMSCPLGLVSLGDPKALPHDDIVLGSKAAFAAGRLDMGQGAVTAANRVVAVEGPEGTMEMLSRVRDIKAAKRARWKAGQGVLVKCSKPEQDMRFDVPVIGPDTIMQVKDAGLAGIAVEAGKVLLLEREKLIQRAEKEKIFVMGISFDEMEITK